MNRVVNKGSGRTSRASNRNIPVDRIRDAVEAVTKARRSAPPDYEYDVFVSYIRGSSFQDWLHRVLVLLESWLALELARTPLFFYDSSIGPGKSWRNELLHALRTSRCMVPILTPQYFQSSSLTLEWQSFLRREQQVGTELVFPVYVQKNGDYPEEVRRRECLDLTDHVSLAPGYWLTPRALQLEDKLREFARHLAVKIKEAPAFRPDFPIVDENASSPFVTLAESIER